LVLGVSEEPLLRSFAEPPCRRYRTNEACDIAQQEGRKAVADAIRPLGARLTCIVSAIEVDVATAALGERVVLSIAEVDAELVVVIADRVRPVIYNLILAGLLQSECGGRAVFQIAAVIGSIGRNRDVELRQASRQRQRSRVGVRYTEVVA